MSDRRGFESPVFREPVFVEPQLPAAALASVRTRRIVALLFDLIFVSILSFALWLALAVLTFGLSLLILPPLFPAVAFFSKTASRSLAIAWQLRGCVRWDF